MLNEREHKQDLQLSEEWLAKETRFEHASAILKLNEYLRRTILPINQYQTKDWSNFFEWAVTSTNNIRATKSRIKEYLIENHYSESTIQALEKMTKCGGTNYLLNLTQLRSIINQYRLDKIGLSFQNMGQYDSITSIEMCILLIWCGLSLSESLELKCSAFDYDKTLISWNDKSLNIDELLSQKFYDYANASGYVYSVGETGTVTFKPYNRPSGIFICKGDGGYKRTTMIKQINRIGLNEPFIWMSGRLYSAWRKSLSEQPPNISWDNLSDIHRYFGLEERPINTKWQLMDFKYDWERYCSQQSAFQSTGTVNEVRDKRRIKK